MRKEIEDLDKELDGDFSNLRKLLDMIPKNSQDLESTLKEMQLGTESGEDYYEKREEIQEYLQELADLVLDLNKMEESYSQFTDAKTKLESAAKKAQSSENFKKILDQMQSTKNNVTNITTDAHELQDLIDELKKDTGDCELQTTIAKRKKEFSTLSNKL